VVETRRRQIEDVASSLFRERGYAATSVRDIARALDLQGGSLYAHVSSKEEVLLAIVTRAAERFESAAEEARSATESADPAGRLNALARAHVRVVTEDVQHASVFVHEWRSLSSPHREQVGRRRDAYEARFRAVVADGIERGVFRPVDPTVAAAFMLTALNGVAAWYDQAGRLDAEELGRQLADLSVRSLVAEEIAP
jgi:TetR/AcrR family transcriptional regulator, cholesterol catabolism regulator